MAVVRILTVSAAAEHAQEVLVVAGVETSDAGTTALIRALGSPNARRRLHQQSDLLGAIQGAVDAGCSGSCSTSGEPRILSSKDR